jgi:hypothetical protein
MAEQVFGLAVLVVALAVFWAIHSTIAGHGPKDGAEPERIILWLECVALVCLFCAFAKNDILQLLAHQQSDLREDAETIMGALFASALIYAVFKRA